MTRTKETTAIRKIIDKPKNIYTYVLKTQLNLIHRLKYKLK